MSEFIIARHHLPLAGGPHPVATRSGCLHACKHVGIHLSKSHHLDCNQQPWKWEQRHHRLVPMTQSPPTLHIGIPFQSPRNLPFTGDFTLVSETGCFVPVRVFTRAVGTVLFGSGSGLFDTTQRTSAINSIMWKTDFASDVLFKSVKRERKKKTPEQV